MHLKGGATNIMYQMRTTEERIELLHRRTREMERQRSNRQVAGFGGASALLALLLIAVMIQTIGLTPSGTDDSFTGSSLLGESAGGYVLAAVIAFFVGVIVTAVCYRMRHKKQ